MALETKEKRLITELAAAPSQTAHVDVRMHMHAQMRIPDPDGWWKVGRDVSGMTFLSVNCGSCASSLVLNLSTQTIMYLK